MSDLKKYIVKRKRTDKTFAEDFEEGYEQFKKIVEWPVTYLSHFPHPL